MQDAGRTANQAARLDMQRQIAGLGRDGTGPQVRIRLDDPPAGARAALLVVLTGGAGIALLGWWAPGSWMRGTTRRIDELATSTAAFARAEERDRELDTHLARAQDSQADELAPLARALGGLMDGVARERSATCWPATATAATPACRSRCRSTSSWEAASALGMFWLMLNVRPPGPTP